MDPTFFELPQFPLFPFPILLLPFPGFPSVSSPILLLPFPGSIPVSSPLFPDSSPRFYPGFPSACSPILPRFHTFSPVLPRFFSYRFPGSPLGFPSVYSPILPRFPTFPRFFPDSSLTVTRMLASSPCPISLYAAHLYSPLCASWASVSFSWARFHSGSFPYSPFVAGPAQRNLAGGLPASPSVLQPSTMDSPTSVDVLLAMISAGPGRRRTSMCTRAKPVRITEVPAADWE